jgi:hypothetical protein
MQRFLSRTRSLQRVAFLVAALIWFGRDSALASDQLPEVLSRFEITVTKASRSLFGGRGDSQATLHLLSQVREEIDTGHWKEAIETVHRIRYANQADEVVRTGSQLIDQIEFRAKAAGEAEVQEIEAAVQRAGDACLKAVNPRELDKIVAELRTLGGGWRNDGRSESQEMFRARAKLGAALGYIQVWQDYLALRAAGNEADAARKMEDLARRNEWYPVVARSEVLGRSIPPSPSPTPGMRFDAAAALAEIFAAVKSLDDLDVAATQLDRLSAEHPSEEKIRATADAVMRLQRTRRALAAKDYTGAFQLATIPLGHSGDVAEQLLPLRHQLLIEVLPYYLPAHKLPPPVPGERLDDYLLRTAKSAMAEQNWLLALRSLEALNAFCFSQQYVPSWLHADMQALKSIIQGDKEAAAGDFVRAAMSFQIALATTSENVPLPPLAERLRLLRKHHPQAFQVVPAPTPTRPRAR